MCILFKKINVYVVVFVSVSNIVNIDMMGCFIVLIIKIFVLLFVFFYMEMIGIYYRDK